MEILISLIGGLGLFLYGMTLMGNGLQKAAGEKLKKIVELLTSNVLLGVLVGAGVTAIIQSSSATTVMVVGFVNAGIMTLSQAIGVIMGANIGTTITAQLVSFNLEGLAPITLGIGIALYLFSSKSKTKNIAEILLGFGILFTGMEFMKDAVSPLAEYKGFTDALVNFGHRPLLGVLLGLIITGVVQSSSASMGMLIALASQGIIPLQSALPILYGDNIGTCVTSLLSSIGANKNAKRAAIMHLLFNILGTLMFLLILNKPIVAVVTRINPTDVARQIANAHTLFNIVTVIILLPFSKYIVKLAMKIVPQTEEEKEVKTYLDERMLETPSIAFANTLKETNKMAKVTNLCLNSSMSAFLNKSKKDVEETFKIEKDINDYQRNILNYLLKLSKTSLTGNSVEEVDNLFNTINDLERIGDHSENIAELAEIAIDKDVSISNDGQKEIEEMFEKVKKNYEDALILINKKDKKIAERIIKTEEEVDNIEKSIRANHIYRLNNNTCEIDSGILYLDLVSNLERISDHCSNIAIRVLNY
ncbi:Na/Pi cotransporter family protein [Romboutsia sp. 1001216sp1]|uniref:Na/Pi cotransporter family protein n=1 Tax=unclassified Romboutsia TaxID=2626894 RepID=UPI00189F107A|nr:MULTISPECIES: Na/Pi cotransporter family protein [unclassified Romboutsia]MDB8791846.1 Na/Pi cotransporter family protein [Romboutsia sp. 1001216sp1]MDB8802467.1 Na/Pi cotransporter family protein [Romboutsia sp. 1001216sp1]MDB8813864.1 Na/Pi cotransporter family protein [Romboutsia sp. 1001216sp1]